MDYVFSQIDKACDEVQRALAEMKLRHEKGIFPTETTGTKKIYWRKEDGTWARDSNGKRKCKRKFILVATGHHESKELSVRTIKHLEDALLTMRRAAIYAERVEWLTSDDDDEQSFCERLEKQLSESEKTGGVE